MGSLPVAAGASIVGQPSAYAAGSGRRSLPPVECSLSGDQSGGRSVNGGVWNSNASDVDCLKGVAPLAAGRLVTSRPSPTQVYS